jgi:hypothetical protein
MGYYSGAMLALAVLLAERDSVYDDMVVKFLGAAGLGDRRAGSLRLL